MAQEQISNADKLLTTESVGSDPQIKSTEGQQGKKMQDANFSLTNENIDMVVKRKNQIQTDKRPCFMYNNTGRCKFGETCKYSHLPSKSPFKWPQENEVHRGNATESNNIDHAKRKQCIYHQKGYCKFGNKCRNYHEKDSNHLPKHNQLSQDCFNYIQGYCKFGERCKFNHGKSRQNTKRPECKLFQRGMCKSGSNCQFIHISKDAKDSETETIASTDKGKNEQGLEISRLASQLQAISEALKKAGLMA